MTFRTTGFSLVATGTLLALAGCGDHLGFDAAYDVADVATRDTGADVVRTDASDAPTPIDVSDSGAEDTVSVDAAMDTAPDTHGDAFDAPADVAPTETGADAADVRVDATGDTTADALDAGTDAPGDASADSGALDAAADGASDVADTGVDAAPAWRHSIVIDGTNDFTPSSEAFTTTSSGYTAYVTWDSSNLYIGYDGADIASGSMTRWLFAFIDTDPGAGIGATSSPSYNTETVGFSGGFAPEFYVRWRASNDFQTIEQYVAGAWSTSTATPQTFQSGTYVELRVPLSAVGNPTRFGVTMLMMNEAAGAEAAYGGLYSGNFTDGYHATVPVSAYLLVDLGSSAAPDSAANRH